MNTILRLPIIFLILLLSSCNGEQKNKDGKIECNKTATINDIVFCMPKSYSHTLVAASDNGELRKMVYELEVEEDETIIATYVDNTYLQGDNITGYKSPTPSEIIIVSMPRVAVLSKLDLEDFSKQRSANLITPQQLYEKNTESEIISDNYYWDTSQELFIEDYYSQPNCWSYLTMKRVFSNTLSDRSDYILKMSNHISLNNFHFRITYYSNYYGDSAIKNLKRDNDEFISGLFKANPEMLKINSIELNEKSYSDYDDIEMKKDYSLLYEFIERNKGKGRMSQIKSWKPIKFIESPEVVSNSGSLSKEIVSDVKQDRETKPNQNFSDSQKPFDPEASQLPSRYRNLVGINNTTAAEINQLKNSYEKTFEKLLLASGYDASNDNVDDITYCFTRKLVKDSGASQITVESSAKKLIQKYTAECFDELYGLSLQLDRDKNIDYSSVKIYYNKNGWDSSSIDQTYTACMNNDEDRKIFISNGGTIEGFKNYCVCNIKRLVTEIPLSEFKDEETIVEAGKKYEKIMIDCFTSQ